MTRKCSLLQNKAREKSWLSILGKLWATPNVDKGATFRFTLPASGESQS
jgi:hypothetical protein